MPQMTLEFSSNVFEKNDLASLFKKCHTSLAETLPTDIKSCKSRATEQNNFLVGNGNEKNAFIHAALHVMPGRTTHALEKTAAAILDILKMHFAKSLQELELQITVAVYELPNIYLKITS